MQLQALIISQAGKMVLIKLNLIGNPFHTMSCTKIPNNIFEELDSSDRNSFGVIILTMITINLYRLDIMG